MVSLARARTALIVVLFASLGSAQPSRITNTIDGRRPVMVRSSVPRQAQSRFDQGAVEPNFRLGNITLMLKPSDSQRASLEQLLAEQQDPSSPNYHKWLTPEGYAERFGPSAEDVEKISAWLRSEGFSVEYKARGR